MHPLRQRASRSVLHFFLLIGSISFLLSACDNSLVVEVPVGNEVIIEPLPVSTPTASLSPTPAPTIRQTPIINIDPSPTPRIEVAVYAPPVWSETLLEIFNQLNSSEGSWLWLLVPDLGQAQLDLKADSDGLAIASRPIILTVPFTSSWESINLDEALAIVAQGHEFVSIVDWHDIRPDRKALRVDGRFPTESGYPLSQPWSIHAHSGFENAAATLGSLLQNPAIVTRSISIAAVGDIMLDRALGYALTHGNVAYPFERVQPFLSSADLTIGNHEASLGTLGIPAEKSYTFQAPPEAAESLHGAGFDILSLANNHALDFGSEALLEGIQLLNDVGIQTVGAGINREAAHTPAKVEIDGLSLAILGYVNVPIEVAGFDTQIWMASDSSPGLAWAHPNIIIQDVARAAQDADIVIVVLHSGYEYVEAPSEPQIAAAHAAIDSGADLVIGHHAHVLQGIEFYSGGVIAYGLGNFAFEIDGDPTTGILKVWLDQTGVRQIELVPAIIQFGGQPRLAESWEAAEIKQRVYYLSSLLNAN